MREYKLPCRRCGASFITTSAAARWCSDVCRARAFRERDRLRRESLRQLVAEVLAERHDDALATARRLRRM